MKSLKKIKFNINYNFSFLLKPLMLLSVLSAVTYALKFFGVKFADKIMLAAMIIIIIPSLLLHMKNAYKKTALLMLLVIFIVLYLNVYDEMIVFLAKKCENSGITFGILNSLFSTFGLTDFENLIYHTSYGGARYINGNIATGAVDIFLLNSSSKHTAMYLSGRYLTLFAMLGISFAVKKHRKEMLFITLFAFISGNFTIFLLTLLLVFTPYYFVFMLFNFLCFFIANAAQLKAGFYIGSSIFELFIYGKNLVYIFILGMFIAAVSYYFSRLAGEHRKWYNLCGDDNDCKR